MSSLLNRDTIRGIIILVLIFWVVSGAGYAIVMKLIKRVAGRFW